MNVLMCAPSHYDIRYEINPWMKLRNRIHSGDARSQWNGLYRALVSLGVEVLTVPQKKDCPDMVFTANAGVVQWERIYPQPFSLSRKTRRRARVYFVFSQERLSDSGRGARRFF